MNLTCKRCGTAIPIPAELQAAEGASIACPACGTRYTRRAPRPTASPPTTSSAPIAATHALDPAPTPTPAPAEAAPLAPTFPAGQLVADRYRVVRFIARGGMGEVYEVEDLELRDRVALKTIHPKAVSQQDAVDRFKREIHLARRVTHPNVCRLFDVGYHAESGREPVIFLTMELLEGETLAARLERSGRLPVEEAIPIVRQMAAALAAAHEAGIVHRDFKSENVFLVPVGEGPPRAVVTDFGIARGTRDDRFAANVTSTGEVIGTPAYMAPEQLEGTEITGAADLYSLGVVAFELLTGELPFRGETAIATAVKRLTEPPPSPRRFLADLDPRWEAIVLRCLERDPAQRFASAAALVEALDEPRLDGVERRLSGPMAIAPELSAPTPAPVVRQRRLRWVAAAALVVFALALFSAWVRVRRLREGELGAGSGARRAVAVLGFRNLAQDAAADWLSTALAEMLSTEIAAGEGLRAVSGDEVSRARRELRLATTAELGPADLARLRANLGADVVALGSYTVVAGPQSGEIRLDLRLLSTADGSTLAAIAESGSAARLFDLVARTGARLREGLGATLLADRGSEGAAPANPEATRLYAQGLEKLRAFEPEAARQLLEKAVEVDPRQALARSALATAWAALGYKQRAEREASKAFELAATLPREERLLVEARHWEMKGDWARAAEAYGTLFRAWPDSVDYGLRLAAAQAASGQSDLAQATVATLRALPSPAGDDPRVDLAEAATAGALSDFRRQQAAAVRAAAKAQASGASRLLAEARVSEAWAARNLGDPERAKRAAEEGARLYASAGDRSAYAFALTTLGGIVFDQGDRAGARQRNEEALAIYREIGDRGGTARSLNNIAVVVRGDGDREAARRLYEEAIGLCGEIGDRACAGHTANNLGLVLGDLGDLNGARERFEAFLATSRALGDQAGAGAALNNLGVIERRLGRFADANRHLEESLAVRREIAQKVGELSALNSLGQLLLDQGKLPDAERLLDQAVKLARSLGNKSATAQALAELAEVPLAGGDFARARAHFEEALSLRNQIGEATAAAEARLGLARVAAESGDLAEGERLARTAAADLAAAGLVDLAASAESALCRLLGPREVGRPASPAARTACAAAVKSAEATQSPAVRLGAAIAAARALGDRRALTAAADEARATGLGALELEARLAWLGLTAPGARPAGAIEGLARDAELRGFVLLARRARALAG